MKSDQSHRMSLKTCVLLCVFANALASNATDPDENWSRKMPTISSKQDVNPRYASNPEKSEEGLRSKLIYSPEQMQEHQQTVGATLSFKHPQFTGIEKVIRNSHKSAKAFEEKQSYDGQPMIQQSESGVVYQVHPQALKNGQVFQTPQSFKQIQADGSTLNFVPHQYPSLPQPQYLVQQPQNTLLSKQPAVFYSQPIQAATPLPYSIAKLPTLSQYSASPQLNYQPTSQTVLPTQYGQYLANPKLPAPQKLVGAYPLTQQSYIDKGKAVSGLANYKAAPNVALPHGVIGQGPQHGSALVFGQTQQNQAVNFLGDDTQGGGPDFSKMFQSYFNSGPFAQSFQNDGEKPSGTSLIPSVNSEFNNFFGELNQAAPTNVVKKEPAEDQFKPCNFFQASNAKVQEDDSDDYKRPSKAQRPYRGPYRDSSEEDDDDEDSDDDSSEDTSSEQKYKYPQKHEESLNRYKNDDNVDYTPYRKPKSGQDEESGPSRNRYAGKTSNLRKGNSNRPRNSYEDDDDEDDEPAKKFRTEREKQQFENNYKEARARYVDSSDEEEANERAVQKEASNPNTKTFYQYKYPPVASYNAEGRTKPQSAGQGRPEHRGASKTEKRPPPVREQDTVGYYSNVSPKVTRDYVYTSQKVVMSANHPDLKNEMLKGV